MGVDAIATSRVQAADAENVDSTFRIEVRIMRLIYDSKITGRFVEGNPSK